MAKDLSGDKVRFYLWFGSITDGLADTINTAKTAGTALTNSLVVGNDKVFSADGNTAAPTLVAANALWLRGVDVVSNYGTTTNTTTLQPYGEEAFNIRTASTINDITITVWPDLEEELERRVWTDVDADSIRAGAGVVLVQRVLGNENTVKHYHIAVGTIGAISHSPQKESAQSYSRVIAPTALAFGITGPAA